MSSGFFPYQIHKSISQVGFFGPRLFPSGVPVIPPFDPVTFFLSAQAGPGNGIIGFALFTGTGSLAPDSQFTGKDGILYSTFEMACNTATFDFEFVISGDPNPTPAQTAVFNSFHFVDANGFTHNFTAASADFTPGGFGQATWIWHQPNGQMFIDGGPPITITLFRRP